MNTSMCMYCIKAAGNPPQKSQESKCINKVNSYQNCTENCLIRPLSPSSFLLHTPLRLFFSFF